ALRLLLLAGDKNRVLRIASRMVGRKVQRFKVQVVSLDLRPFGHRISHGAKDVHDLVHGAQHRMLGAQRAANAGESNVEALQLQPARRSGAADSLQRGIDRLLDLSLELVDTRTDVAFGRTRRRFQPKIVDLGEKAVLARYPTVTKDLPVVFG